MFEQTPEAIVAALPGFSLGTAYKPREKSPREEVSERRMQKKLEMRALGIKDRRGWFGRIAMHAVAVFSKEFFERYGARYEVAEEREQYESEDDSDSFSGSVLPYLRQLRFIAKSEFGADAKNHEDELTEFITDMILYYFEMPKAETGTTKLSSALSNDTYLSFLSFKDGNKSK